MRAMPADNRTRSLVLGAGAVVVVVGLLIVALIRQPVQLDPDTAEGTVQAYLQALSDADYAGALALLDPSMSEGCDPGDLAATVDTDFNATLGEVDISDDTAVVRVTIDQGASPGPFDPGIEGFTELFSLERSNGRWLITGDPWPYFTWRCET